MLKDGILWLIEALIDALMLGLPLMLFWNWLMPDIFGLKEISFFQAIGLISLINIFSVTLRTNKE